MEDQNKLLDRFAKLMEEQTEEPSKKDVSAVVAKFYALKKKKTVVDENKPKRAPTAYNVFFKAQMAILKDSEKDMEKDDCMTAKAKMAHVAALWKAKKEDKFEEALSEPEPETDAHSEGEEVEEPVEVEVKVPEPPKKQENKAKYTPKNGGGAKGGGAAKDKK
jgi:hypothetical protein